MDGMVPLLMGGDSRVAIFGSVEKIMVTHCGLSLPVVRDVDWPPMTLTEARL